MGLVKPDNGKLGSGPCPKNPEWSLEKFDASLLGKSHRSEEIIILIKDIISTQRRILAIPDDYLLGIIPGSATGAMECALWNFLRPSVPVDVLSFDVFSSLWAHDVQNVLNLPKVRVIKSDFGTFPDVDFYNPSHDLVSVWCATTSGVLPPNEGNFILKDRSSHDGLTIIDATSSVFCVAMPWDLCDVVAYSWQKGIGSEAGCGMLCLSPRAVSRLKKTPRPHWPIPRLLSLYMPYLDYPYDGKKIDADAYSIYWNIFEAMTINTPSILSLLDMQQCLHWACSIGGGQALYDRTLENANVINDWVEKHHGSLTWLAKKPFRSPSVACIQFLPWVNHHQEKSLYRALKKWLANNAGIVDCINHALAPASLRIWCGPTQQPQEIAKALDWIWEGLNAIQDCSTFV
jgi:phosphoserine aminotransferase